MIARPTTDQILLDCCAELMDGILPSITDEVTAARIVMLDGVLRAVAARTAHEIAWMSEEIAAMQGYVRTVEAAGVAVPAFAGNEPEAATDGLHLADVTDRYCRAGEAFASALEAARELSPELHEAGVRVLEQRVEHERAARGVWSSAAGR